MSIDPRIKVEIARFIVAQAFAIIAAIIAGINRRKLEEVRLKALEITSKVERVQETVEASLSDEEPTET